MIPARNAHWRPFFTFWWKTNALKLSYTLWFFSLFHSRRVPLRWLSAANTYLNRRFDLCTAVVIRQLFISVVLIHHYAVWLGSTPKHTSIVYTRRRRCAASFVKNGNRTKATREKMPFRTRRFLCSLCVTFLSRWCCVLRRSRPLYHTDRRLGTESHVLSERELKWKKKKMNTLRSFYCRRFTRPRARINIIRQSTARNAAFLTRIGTVLTSDAYVRYCSGPRGRLGVRTN